MNPGNKSNKLPQNKIKGFLLDIDGVLYVEKQTIRGAVSTIEYLQKNNIPFRMITNTTLRSRFALMNNLKRLGYKVELDQLFTAPYAAAQWLTENQVRSIHLFMRGDAYREFTGFRITTNKPDYLVIGDIGQDLTYTNLNQAFRLVMNGTRMLALQKNRYWQTNSGLALDAGAIVAGLEYATNQKATVIGKPNINFFNQALKSLDLPAENVAIIGDDMEADIIGGSKTGMYTIAVETGKFKPSPTQNRKKLPHCILPSIASLPEWLEKNGG